MHDWAMRGGLALLSALPERFTAFAFGQFAPSVDAGAHTK
jgi:hypothetical protein